MKPKAKPMKSYRTFGVQPVVKEPDQHQKRHRDMDKIVNRRKRKLGY